MDNRSFGEQQQSLIANLPQVPLIPQQLLPSGSRKDCIRLRGLPYEAQVEQILEFLSEHSKNIVFQGVHMVYNAQVSLSAVAGVGGVPWSGECVQKGDGIDVSKSAYIDGTEGRRVKVTGQESV